jgi:hypothetical protein
MSSFDSPQQLARFAAACWVVARFLYSRRDDDLDCTDPAIIATARWEIDRTIAKKLGGESCGEDLIELCVGACAVRDCCPSARAWVGATALLRSSAAARSYDIGFDFAADRRHVIARIARVLAHEGHMTAAQALWLVDQPLPQRQAA